MKTVTALAVALLLVVPAWAQQSSIDPRKASQYFAEMQAASVRDSGHLWGRPLYGPMLFLDPDTWSVVANQADGEGKLGKQGDVFVGHVPSELGAANTAVKWAGVTWTMVIWPLPEHRRDRIRLMAHECFHRIQSQVGLPATDALNSHLDTKDGRIWLQVEFRALERALWSTGAERRRAIADALYFRAYRRSLIPGSGPREDALELNEGLAEYTGVAIAAKSAGEMTGLAAVKLLQAANNTSFARTFAYTSGPAYGILLDDTSHGWRAKLHAGGSLSETLATAYHVDLPAVSHSEAVSRAQAYDGDDTIALETEREVRRQKEIADAKANFVDGPLLILPLSADVSYQFNPYGMLALDDSMTLYSTLQVTDEWGILRVDNGAMLVRDGGHLVRAQVRAPADPNALQGEGWKLELKSGWKLNKGKRPGDWIVVKAAGN